MSVRRLRKAEVKQPLHVAGILERDWQALSDCQRDCTAYLGFDINVEHEAYLSQHPEIGALVTSFISKLDYAQKSKEECLKMAAEFFAQDENVLDKQILDVPTVSRLSEGKRTFKYTKKGVTPHFRKNEIFIDNIRNIIRKHYPPVSPSISSFDLDTSPTVSSSFLSFPTSDSTVPTPEPVPTPPLTFEELMYQLVSNTVDKAIFFKYSDWDILYDTAYVEISRVVEEAMEVPVVFIREEIAAIFEECYEGFLEDILEKERIAAEIAWNKRMRKKMKRSLRRANNYLGYATPPTPMSGSVSSHDSITKSPPLPCKCHPQWTFNRYQKDRYGIYLPRKEDFESINITGLV